MPEYPEHEGFAGISELALGIAVDQVHLAEAAVRVMAAATGGAILPDYYHLNFGDGPLPIDRIFADARVRGIILKFSEGLSYGDWALGQAPRVRQRGYLGGYHFLRWDESGRAQAEFFLRKYNPREGDLEPTLDFERGSAQHPNASVPIARGRGEAEAFVDRVHDAGHRCQLYGHANVKEAWADWQNSGADAWWVPGDTPHHDVGPQGPDLWQYAPYTAPAGKPTHPAGLSREDVSVVLTSLLIIGGTEMAGFDDYRAGMVWARENATRDAQGDLPSAPDGKSADWMAGFHEMRDRQQDARQMAGLREDVNTALERLSKFDARLDAAGKALAT